MPVSIPRWIRPGHIVVLLIAVLVAVACSSGDSGEVSNQLAPEQEFRLRIAYDVGSFDPQQASFAEDITVAKQLFRGLFTYDQELNVVPSVAAELPTKANGGISEDGLTYTINLRNDVTWSDGVGVTANDFVFALQRLFDPDAGAQGYYYSFYTAIEGAA